MQRFLLRWLVAPAVFLLLLAGIFAGFGVSEALRQPVARKLTLSVQGVHDDFTPLRVALLSDIHLGNFAMRPERLAGIVDQVNRAVPDLVLIAGDFINGHDQVGAGQKAAALVAPLSALKARFGVVAVLGNHDYWTDPEAVRNALEQAGITVLENAAVRRGPIRVIGVGDAFSGHDDLNRAIAAGADLGGVPIVLSHTPDIAGRLPFSVPILFAGHTHCGQIVLPGIGSIVNHSPYLNWRPVFDPRYQCGLIQDPGHSILVTGGLGAGLPIRWGAPPDWWLVTVRKEG